MQLHSRLPSKITGPYKIVKATTDSVTIFINDEDVKVSADRFTLQPSPWDDRDEDQSHLNDVTYSTLEQRLIASMEVEEEMTMLPTDVGVLKKDAEGRYTCVLSIGGIGQNMRKEAFPKRVFRDCKRAMTTRTSARTFIRREVALV